MMTQKLFGSLASNLVVLLAFMLLVSACNISARQAPTPDPNLVGTIAAQTVTAQLAAITATAQALPSATLPLPSDTPTVEMQSTSLPQPPATVVPPTDTQLAFPQISANVETNCRIGPGPEYARVGYLLVGQMAFVRGRNDSQTWWYIENPVQPGNYCWVWGETTLVQGDIAQLPLITPPPPPVADSPGFQSAFSNIHACGGSTVAVFTVSNSGDAAFQAGRVAIKDMTTNTIFAGPAASNAAFLASGATCPPGNALLKPGSTGFISIELPFKLPSGSPARATITLCTDMNMEGKCVETKVNFVFP